MRLELKRASLLYDIGNYAYIAGHRLEMEGGNEQVAHLLTDICAEGNIDRVSRVLATVHAWVVSVLSPKAPVTVSLDNGLYEPDVYYVDIDDDRHLSPAKAELTGRLIHEFMVYKVIADWLSITHPQYAAMWEDKASAIYAEISGTLRAVGTMTRRSTPLW